MWGLSRINVWNRMQMATSFHSLYLALSRGRSPCSGYTYAPHPCDHGTNWRNHLCPYTPEYLCDCPRICVHKVLGARTLWRVAILCLPSHPKRRQPPFLLPRVRVVHWAAQNWYPLPLQVVVAVVTRNLGEGPKFSVYNTLRRRQLGIFYGGSDGCVALSDCSHPPTPGTVGYHTSPHTPFLSIDEGSDHPGSGSVEVTDLLFPKWTAVLVVELFVPHIPLSHNNLS